MNHLVHFSKIDETITVKANDQSIEVSFSFSHIEKVLRFLKYLKDNNLDNGPIKSLTKYIK